MFAMAISRCSASSPVGAAQGGVVPLVSGVCRVVGRLPSGAGVARRSQWRTSHLGLAPDDARRLVESGVVPVRPSRPRTRVAAAASSRRRKPCPWTTVRSWPRGPCRRSAHISRSNRTISRVMASTSSRTACGASVPRRVHAPPYASWKVLDLRVDQCVALLASRRRPSLHRSDRGVGPARPAGEDSTTEVRSGAGYAVSSAGNVPVAIPPARPAAADRPCPAAAAPAETAACAESATICLATACAARSISSSVECVRAPREGFRPSSAPSRPRYVARSAGPAPSKSATRPIASAITRLRTASVGCSTSGANPTLTCQGMYRLTDPSMRRRLVAQGHPLWGCCVACAETTRPMPWWRSTARDRAPATATGPA